MHKTNHSDEINLKTVLKETSDDILCLQSKKSDDPLYFLSNAI